MKFIPWLAALALSLATITSTAAPRAESATVAQARELLDSYYGGSDKLARAAALLEKAYREDTADPHVYLQAARVTVMGGSLGFGRFESGTYARYGALLDKAIALDPSIPKAYILKSEVFHQLGEFDSELAALDRAKGLGADDPWLQMGYARHYRKVGQSSRAFGFLSQVEARGAGSSASSRRAYVSALEDLSGFAVGDDRIEDRLRKYGALALKARDPADAWTPHNFAISFLEFGMLDEAIEYSHLALRTMNFGAAKMGLSVGLYWKAADLKLKGKPVAELKPLIDEARALGVGRVTVLESASRKRRITTELLYAMQELIP
jgi:tetratricopeptide (TPR) repeat protein